MARPRKAPVRTEAEITRDAIAELQAQMATITATLQALNVLPPPPVRDNVEQPNEDRDDEDNENHDEEENFECEGLPIFDEYPEDEFSVYEENFECEGLPIFDEFPEDEFSVYEDSLTFDEIVGEVQEEVQEEGDDREEDVFEIFIVVTDAIRKPAEYEGGDFVGTERILEGFSERQYYVFNFKKVYSDFEDSSHEDETKSRANYSQAGGNDVVMIIIREDSRVRKDYKKRKKIFKPSLIVLIRGRILLTPRDLMQRRIARASRRKPIAPS